ncbi:MAG TPA: hypothetical protein EYN73_02300 [Chromatiaceae bacterium]|jgi:phosphatidylserine decarboxylase|nr:hypothetical protein [Chromatiaceae bacterium]HIB84947.1 hypothetical protein [Chromatiaceae bacterium]HIN82973.1 hypothetical protein [Chromatiales bacterium]HIO15110.1 hypothetical protein [Chromatiales bacterium]HIO54594.1 hypothetical protein [Chromatiales bacterium]
MSAGRPIIAKEGWGYISIPCILSLVAFSEVGPSLGWPLLLVSVVMAAAFRDPRRDISSNPLAVVSPADGEIVAIDKIHDVYLDRDAIRIRIRTSTLGVYTIRSPIEGKLLDVWNRIDTDDLGVNSTPLCSARGFAVWVQTDEADDVVVAMYGKGLRRPRCYSVVGERVGQGQSCGCTPFGACIDVMVPANSRIAVEVNTTVMAGSDVLGSLVHE